MTAPRLYLTKSPRSGTAAEHSNRTSLIVHALLAAAWILFTLTSLNLKYLENSEGYLGRSASALSWVFFSGPRPFTTDLMYKVWGSDPHRVVVGQIVLSAVSWSLLAHSAGAFVRGVGPRILISLSVFATMGWWNVMGWNFVMRCESCVFSFMALFLAATLTFVRSPSRRSLLVLCAVTLLFSFTRDNLPIVLVLLSFAIAALAFRRARSTATWKPAWSYPAWCVAVLVLQGYTVGHVHGSMFKTRHEFPLINVMLARIVPNLEFREWFTAHGLPPEIIEARAHGITVASSKGKILFRDPKYDRLLSWIRTDAKPTYVRFLLEHPRQLLDPLSAPNQLFPADLANYTGPPQPPLIFKVIRWGFPLITPALGLAISLLAGLTCLRSRSHPNPLLVLCAAMGLLVWVNALAIFHFDSMEVPRHGVMNLVWLHLSALFGVIGWMGR